MKQPLKGILIGLAFLCIAAVVLVGVLFAGFYFSMVSTIMTKKSPDRTHTAKLTRVSGIDVNFKVYVDGHQVYFSPDFAPVHLDFRERIIWDASGQLLILEVAGKRIFGYHVEQKRNLSDDELLAAKLAPFEEYRYEGTLPKEPHLNSTVTPSEAVE